MEYLAGLLTNNLVSRWNRLVIIGLLTFQVIVKDGIMGKNLPMGKSSLVPYYSYFVYDLNNPFPHKGYIKMVTLEELKKGAESFFANLTEEEQKAGSAIELYCLHLAHTLEARHGELTNRVETEVGELDNMVGR